MYLVILILTPALLMDVSGCRIPNWYTGGAMLISQAWVLTHLSVTDGVRSFIGAMLILLILFPLFMIGGIGAGDLKMIIILPCYMSFGECSKIIWISLVITAFLGTIKLIAEHEFLGRTKDFLLYLKGVSGCEIITSYDPHHGRHELASDQIHFTLPLFLSTALFLGGIITL